MTDFITIADDENVRTIRFNRADKKNAITQDMYAKMADGIESASDDGIRAILFLGQPGVFSAGNDIADFLSRGMTDDMSATATVRFLKALATTGTPLVAAVDGLAIGVGATMLMHCDMVFASEAATLKTPFLNLGVVPEAASSLIAPRIMGQQRAFEMLIMGETFSAERARESGLVNHVTSSDKLEATAMAAVKKLSMLAPGALSISRKLLRGDTADITARMDEEFVLFAERLKSDEAREAFAAFMEKRPPRFA
ncbi:MAG: crotonase/enoyl-CoA hydratase family protein [Hyphomicrobiales bacterium]